jgi:hypothetical protein
MASSLGVFFVPTCSRIPDPANPGSSPAMMRCVRRSLNLPTSETYRYSTYTFSFIFLRGPFLLTQFEVALTSDFELS